MCRAFKRLVPRYIDGRLSLPDARRVELHLELCGACRRDAEKLSSGVTSPLQARFNPESPDDYLLSTLRGDVREGLFAGVSGHAILRVILPAEWWMYAAGLAAVVVGFVAVVLL